MIADAAQCRFKANASAVALPTPLHRWTGFVYVAFVIGAYARRARLWRAAPQPASPALGWKVSTSATTDFVLHALEQAIDTRRHGPEDGLFHHSDRRVQYFAMNYTQRLTEGNLVPSVGSVGDSYALAETINGLYKAEVIAQQLA